jgi:two-component system, LytTR family, sensor kinase
MTSRSRLWLGVLISSLVGTLFFTYLCYSETGELPVYPQKLGRLLYSLVVANLAGGLVWLLSKGLNRVLPWQQYFSLRFLAALLLSTVLVLAAILGTVLLYWLLFREPIGVQALLANRPDTALKLVIISVISVFVYTVLDFTFFSYNQYAVVQIASMRLAQVQLALQFEVLKSQLSPHYLFNCLNTISSLLYQPDRQLTAGFIRRLAQTYQYVLRTHDQQLVPVAEELAFAEAYAYLLKVRFGEAIQLKIDLPPAVLARMVPPLTLQLLLENAVKHNTLTEEEPLQVEMVAEENDVLVVRNNLREKPEQKESFKIGLENIRRRYHFLTHRQPEVVQDGQFTVRLPLL